MMKNLLIQFVKKTPLHFPLRNLYFKGMSAFERGAWERNGRPLPPPHAIKQQTLIDYATRFGLKILVETGTYYGDMVEAMKDHFEQIFSIELSEYHFAQASKRFKKSQHVNIIYGNSAVELGTIVQTIKRPALFWLDGHFSDGGTARGESDTPIYQELGQIFSAPDQGHVVIIDDARCFGTVSAYPTQEELFSFIRKKRFSNNIEVQSDSIRITPVLPESS